MAEPITKLASWLSELAQSFKEQRQNLLEPQWRLAYDAFKGKFSSENLARWKALEGHEWRSKVFVRLTKMKVVSAVSSIEDIEFQNGQLPWEIKPEPIPEDMRGNFLPNGVADIRCRRMAKIIDGNLDVSEAIRDFRRALLEEAIYGTCCIKAPVIRTMPVFDFKLRPPGGMQGQFSPEWLSLYGTHEPQTTKRRITTVQYCPIWEMLWDLEAHTPQEGQGIFHWQMMSPGRLMDLSDDREYDRAAIRNVVEKYASRGPSGGQYDVSEAPYTQYLTQRRQTIPVYEFVGRVPKEYLRDTMDTGKITGREVEIVCTFASDDIPMMIRRPVESFYPGKIRPFFFGTFEEVPGESGGVGIAENIRDSQMMVNSSVRSFVDNKALASNLLIFGRSNALSPGQSKDLWTGKWFDLANSVRDVREAFSFQTVPDASESLVDMINLFERFADEESNIPKILEGETPQFNPKTAFAFGQLMQSANKGLGKIIRNRELQQYIPIIRALYHWEMLTNPDESVKGAYAVHATGFSSYRDRIQRAQTLQALLQMTLANQMLTMMIQPYAHLEEIYRTSGLDPERFLKSQDQVEQQSQMMMQQIAQPPGMGGPMPRPGRPAMGR